jgi:hypothetical protein
VRTEGKEEERMYKDRTEGDRTAYVKEGRGCRKEGRKEGKDMGGNEDRKEERKRRK